MKDLLTYLQEEQENFMKADELAKNVLKLARNTLLVNLRFLDMALSRFDMVPMDGAWMTDGHFLLYDPRRVLVLYRNEKERPTHDLLHMVLHGIFRHMFINTLVDRPLWDLSCDMAVEASLIDLGLSAACLKKEEEEKRELEKLRASVNMLTAEKLYHYFQENPLSDGESYKLSALFGADDHDLWYMPEKEVEIVEIDLKQQRSGKGKGNAEESDDQQGDRTEKKPKELSDLRIGKVRYARLVSKGQVLSEASEEAKEKTGAEQDSKKASGTGLKLRPLARSAILGDDLEADWKDISERMQTDMETFSKKQGTGAGNLMQNLQAVNREKYDYTSFLRKFATMGEAMKINDDEFDYIFYTYGLELYKKVPLIEPLEYKDVKKIREFVIAIDTSGSTSGELVQKFVQKTYNILKSEESFFTRINLHIIQCDAEIQEDARITNQEEFDTYLKTMKLRGTGGTDFRPVFSYVDDLVKNKEFRNLKGLIYLTDGWGEFPSKKPDYETAFVFIDDDYNNPEVPSWAIRLVLQRDEI